MDLCCNSLAELAALGRFLSQIIEPGDRILLAGDLGAGKTTLVSEICKGLGFNDASSPTFTLVQQYSTQPPVYHLDLYRLRSEQDILMLDLGRVLDDETAVVFIEWADKLGDLTPDDYLAISISILEGEARRISFEGKGSRFVQLVDKIAQYSTTS